MRTTVDLPDDLAKAAKVLAAQRGETLKEVLTRAVAREVAVGAVHRRGARMPWPVIGGGTAKKYDITNEDIADILAEDDLRYVL